MQTAGSATGTVEDIGSDCRIEGRRCPSCGTDLPPNAAFCPVCGRAVGESKPSKKTRKRNRKAAERARKRLAGEGSILLANDLTGISMAYENGIIESSVRGHFSRSIEFSDISYEDERRDQQELIFERLCQLHGFFPAKSVYQITLANIATFGDSIERYLPEIGGTADMARCFNDIIETQLREGRIGIERKNYLTFAVDEPDLEHAERTLANMRNGAKRILERLGSNAIPMDGMQRMRALHDIIRGRQEPFLFDYGKLRDGSHARDYLAPAWAAYRQEDVFLRRSFQMPGRCVQTLWIRDFGSDLSDRAIRGIRSLKIPMVISLLFVPQVKKDIVKDVRGNIAAIQGEIYDYQGQVARGYGDITRLPPHMEERETESREVLSFLIDRDQNMNWFQGLITVFAPNPEALKSYVQMVKDEAGVWSIDLAELALRQEEAFTSALPLATTHLGKNFRSLPTAESAIMVPFSSQTIRHNPLTSYYLGQDAVTNEPIFVDPTVGNSPHMWIMGITGAGKGMEMNAIMTFSNLCYPHIVYDERIGSYAPQDKQAPSWFVFDFHGEYSQTVLRLGGRVDQLGPSFDNRINPLDISNTAGLLTKKAVQENTDFFLALFESMMGHILEQREKSILDRCLTAVYEPHLGKDSRPVLEDLYNVLKVQDDALADDLAVSLEMYVHGSMRAFNGQTNIEPSPFLESFDCSALGPNMQTFAMLTTMQYVRNRTFENYRASRPTVLVMEEVQILFENDAAVGMLDRFFSEMRKYGLRIICITQLPRRVLEHPRASYLFDNSGIFVFLANQKNNVDRIGNLFRLSESQKETMAPGVDPGSGLVIVGGVKIAMKNPIPTGNILYELWNTDPDKMARQRPEDASSARAALEEFSDNVIPSSAVLRVESQDGRMADIELSAAELNAVMSAISNDSAQADPEGAAGKNGLGEEGSRDALRGVVPEGYAAPEAEKPWGIPSPWDGAREVDGEEDSAGASPGAKPDGGADERETPVPASDAPALGSNETGSEPAPGNAPEAREPDAGEGPNGESADEEGTPAAVAQASSGAQDRIPPSDPVANATAAPAAPSRFAGGRRGMRAAAGIAEPVSAGRPTRSTEPPANAQADGRPGAAIDEEESKAPGTAGSFDGGAHSAPRETLTKAQRRLYLDQIGVDPAIAARLEAERIETLGALLDAASRIGGMQAGSFGLSAGQIASLRRSIHEIGAAAGFEGLWE